MSATQVMRAWSCTVRLVVDDERAIRPAAADLAALLARVDAAASRFRPDSALSKANSSAGRPVPVPRLLVDLVAVALDAADTTGGLVDPTVGTTLGRLGYDRDIAAVSADGPAAPSAAVRTWRDVRLDRDAGLLTVPPGAALDLGATAKSYLADHAAHALAQRYGTAVLVELGGDLAVAGNRPQGWCIDVAERAGDTGQHVLVRHGGMATSTTVIRRWRRGGAAVHHIVDPRTGRPAAGPWRTVSVYAPCALAANTASTAGIVLGADALGWFAARNLAARFVAVDGVVTTVGGWPQQNPLAVSA
ncbi:MAG: FAD:protein FMN transferase [Jatrophihabitantaceae bacterium]